MPSEIIRKTGFAEVTKALMPVLMAFWTAPFRQWFCNEPGQVSREDHGPSGQQCEPQPDQPPPAPEQFHERHNRQAGNKAGHHLSFRLVGGNGEQALAAAFANDLAVITRRADYLGIGG